MSFVETGLASAGRDRAPRSAPSPTWSISASSPAARRCAAHDGTPVSVITALAPLPHPRFSRFFAQIKQDLGFGIYVPDCDTTACSFSAATQAGSTDPILDQPLLDFYAGYQVGGGANEPQVTVPLNDNIDYEGGVVTWIDNLDGERPFGNDLDPTLNLDILEVSFRNLARWKIIETPQRLDTVHRIIGFQKRLAAERRVRRSALAYLLSAGALLRLFRPLLCGLHRAAAGRAAGDRSRRRVRVHPRSACWPMCEGELIAAEMNAFDAALALIALGHLGAERRELHAGPALHRQPSRRRRPARAVQGL